MANLSNKISILIDKDLKKSGEREFAQRRNRLIGKEVVSYGVKVREIRKIVKEYFKRFSKEKWREIVKELMSTKVFENQMAGIFLLDLFLKTEEKISISEIEELIKDYIDNWATCDTISGEVVAKVLTHSPKEIKSLDTWAKSRNVWLKRAALVTIVKLKNKIENWQRIASEILSSLSEEREPILKKAIHWLQKEVL
jgi:3-methyladenine DNA glycosylase AlkD